MKKLFLLFALVIMQSCIPIHTAKRIPSYEISDEENTKNTYVDLSTYTFEYNSENSNFRKITRNFFELSEDVNVYNFETEALIEDRTVKIFISESSDTNSYLNLMGLFVPESNNNESESERETKDNMRKLSTSGISSPLNYIHIQIMDQDGSDLLADDGLLKAIAIQKLKQFQLKINSDE